MQAMTILRQRFMTSSVCIAQVTRSGEQSRQFTFNRMPRGSNSAVVGLPSQATARQLIFDKADHRLDVSAIDQSVPSAAPVNATIAAYPSTTTSISTPTSPCKMVRDEDHHHHHPLHQHEGSTVKHQVPV